MKAIASYECNLYTKTIKSLMIHQIKQKQLRKNEIVVRHRQEKSLTKVYFKVLRRKFLRAERLRQIKKVILDFHDKGMAKRTYRAWRDRVQRDKRRYQAYNQLLTQRVPFAVEILFEYLAYRGIFQHMELESMKGQLVPDLVKFHALANSTLTKPDPTSSHMVLVTDASGATLKRKRVLGHIRLRKANLDTFNSAIELALL